MFFVKVENEHWEYQRTFFKKTNSYGLKPVVGDTNVFIG